MFLTYSFSLCDGFPEPGLYCSYACDLCYFVALKEYRKDPRSIVAPIGNPYR